MRLYTIDMNGTQRVAVEKDEILYPVKNCSSMNELIDHFSDGIELEEEGISLSEAWLLAPIPVPKQDVICLGINYRSHQQELKDDGQFEKKEHTIYFSKRVNEAPGTGGIIPSYDFVDSLDYEVELAAVIGQDCRNVSVEDALDFVFGYTILNDISSRNIQKAHQQWYRGKSLDGHTPMGPCIVTADEVEGPQNLEISCHVNGELRQKSNTSQMITTVAEAISELSEGMTLKAGTIIATGTPSGVALGMENPKWLKTGDEVICRIEKIGELKNTVE